MSPQYKNARGYQKSHGHCKAHILTYLVESGQISPSERKEILKLYRLQTGSLLDFLRSHGLHLPEIHQFWAGKFYGSQKDTNFVTLSPAEIEVYDEMYRRKNET